MAKRKQTESPMVAIEEIPRAGTPDAKKLKRRARVVTIYVWAAVLLFPLALLGIVTSVSGGATATSVSSSDGKFAETRAVATKAVNTWLATSPAPLPGGRIQAWDGAKIEKAPVEPTEVVEDPIRQETHSFTLINASGTLFTTTVQIAVSNSNGIQVASTPSLLPVSASDPTAYVGSTWPGYPSQVSTSDAVDQAISQWARAFTNTDPNDLRLAVGDPSEDHTYVPLSGATIVQIQVKSSAELDKEVGSDAPATKIIVQVQMKLRWGPAPKQDDVSKLPVATYDLLIVGADTAAPKVVAWGGPGTGPHLVKYGNAVVGLDASLADEVPLATEEESS